MKNFNTPSEFCISRKGNYLDTKSSSYGIEMTLTASKPGSELVITHVSFVSATLARCNAAEHSRRLQKTWQNPQQCQHFCLTLLLIVKWCLDDNY